MITRRGLLGLLGGLSTAPLWSRPEKLGMYASGGVVRDFHVGEFIGERPTQTLTLKVDASQVRGAIDSHVDRIKSAVDAAIKDHAERLHRRITTGPDEILVKLPKGYTVGDVRDVPNRLAGAWINSEGEAV